MHCEIADIDAGVSEEYRMVVLLPASGGSRTSGSDMPPSGLKPKHPENGLKRRGFFFYPFSSRMEFSI